MAEGVVYLTPEQIAGQLQITTRTVYRWLDAGTLKGFKLGRVWRVKKADFEEFMDQHENAQGKEGFSDQEEN